MEGEIRLISNQSELSGGDLHRVALALPVCRYDLTIGVLYSAGTTDISVSSVAGIRYCIPVFLFLDVQGMRAGV